jgi:hypothetical protein
MAARKIKRLTDDWRAKIQTTMLIKRLQDHAEGKVDMSPTQIKAAEVLLRKSAPDLSSTTLEAGEGLAEAIKGIGIKFV